MAALVLLRNPLTPHTRELFPLDAGTAVIDWLQSEHPNGFGMPIRFYVNGVEKPLDDLDYEVAEDDVAIIALMPAEPVSLTTIGVSLLISAALAAASYYAMRAFMPKDTSGKMTGKVSTFDVASEQNAAKVGEPIPVVYGTVLTSPDYISQPYTWYMWDQSSFGQPYNGIQYLDLLMCVGQGDISVTDVFVGDTKSKTIDAGVVQWNSFRPFQHKSQMGIISSLMGGGFHENVVSSPEVSNQEFVDLNDAAGFFATAKPGITGNKFQLDIMFPSGATNPDGSGDIKGRETEFKIEYVELDDNDLQVGIVRAITVTASTENGVLVTGPNIANVVTSSVSEKNMTAITAPIRRSYMVTTSRSARWAVKVTRLTPAPNSNNGTDRFVWVGLKLYADYTTDPVYGDVTLLACRIKASQGLGQDASIRIRVKANRLISPPNGGTEVASTSAADAFADVYLNQIYGAARPRTELDTATLTSLRTKWAGYEFNHVFRERTTVWDALRTITIPFAAEPLPLGSMMTVAQDGVKDVRSMMFTDANIVSGSMNVNYSFDDEGAADGVEIEYLDPKDFRQSYVVYPADALRPDRYTLDGVTDAVHARQYARLTWQRTRKQRKTISFETELEGLLLEMGDRIGISHSVPKWGDSGFVIGVSGNRLVVDHNLDWSGTAAKYIMLRNPFGSATTPVMVTQGSQPNIVVLPSTPPATINVDNEYEYASFAFGTAANLTRDFIVTASRPSGENTVTVEAVNYDPTVFTGAMSFLV